MLRRVMLVSVVSVFVLALAATLTFFVLVTLLVLVVNFTTLEFPFLLPQIALFDLTFLFPVCDLFFLALLRPLELAANTLDSVPLHGRLAAPAPNLEEDGNC